MKKLSIVDKTLETGTIVCFSALIVVVTLQISMRFLPFSVVWTEELSRFLFIYSVAFAAPLAMKRKEFVNVDILINKLPQKIKKVHELIIYLVTVILTAVIAVKGLEFLKLGVNQKSATMAMVMSIPYASIFITTLFITIYAIHHLIQQFKLVREGGVGK